MAEVTLTASMRANLYNLQQTANLMGTTQNRLSTGKKVNSALDNPNNYFTAQSLSNRASDINSLLDGMGQAIQAIKAATQGIEAAQKTIESMKAVANSALSSANSSAAGARTPYEVAGTSETEKVFSTTDKDSLLVNLKNATTGTTLGITVGQTFTVSYSGGTTSTFTVKQDSSIKDLTDFLGNFNSAIGGGGVMTFAANASGAITLAETTGQNLVVAGTLATAMGLNGTFNNTGTTSVTTANLGTGPMMLTDMTSGSSVNNNVSLTSLTDADGKSLGIAVGDKLTFKLGNTGKELTFTVGGEYKSATADRTGKDGGGATLEELQNWMLAQGNATSDAQLTMTSGKLSVANGSTLEMTLGGKLATALGLDGSVAASGSKTATNAVYTTPLSASPVATGSTLLRDLTRANGFLANDSAGTGSTAPGNQLVLTTGSGSQTIQFTADMTVQDLMNKVNAIDSSFKMSLDTQGRLVMDNQTGSTWTISGSGVGVLSTSAASVSVSNNSAGSPTVSSVQLYSGYKAAAGSAATDTVIDATKKTQFDTLRTQLDELVKDASYQGINLISGTGNSPLTVTFNEAATNASKLVISAVDLTTSGLSIKGAAGELDGSWKNADSVRSTLSNLTAAATTLRNQAATLGYNLSTVQNRQDFANNMIATLKEGADKLTLADMNEEGANMLALQTRSQLGTQSLSLASQANQAVMRLFG